MTTHLDLGWIRHYLDRRHIEVTKIYVSLHSTYVRTDLPLEPNEKRDIQDYYLGKLDFVFSVEKRH